MNLRPSPIAGQWYPGQAPALKKSIESFLAQASVPKFNNVVGIVAPHAGHVYSGRVAAHSFNAVGGNPEVVVILCPSHFHAEASLITSAHEAYQTPLGSVEIDRALVNQIQQTTKEFSWAEIKNDREHAIEIELPFVQCLFGKVRLVPIMLRDQSSAVAQALGKALATILANQKMLIVASTDLSHYYPDAHARQLDAVMLAQIKNFDPAGVLQAEASGRGFACGHGALAAMLWAAQALGANKTQVLCQATSGDVSGDLNAVVGYGAAVVWKE